MPYYRLERVSDGQKFDIPAADDDEALFMFSTRVGEGLSFDGDGPPPYLFGRTMTAIAFMKADIPVYQKQT